MNLKLMLLTSDPAIAVEAQSCGVDRIFLDMEHLNKRERQRGRNTVISNNTCADVARVRAVIEESDLLVRLNPVNPHTESEIEEGIKNGADILMLPMVMDEDDVKTFVRFVNGRAKVHIMVETPQALARIHRIVDQEGIDEVFIGLNDLHIGMGLTFMFELLSGGLIEYLASILRKAGIPFGFGGIARIGEGLLPANRILGEHFRLGSSSVILSRTFNDHPDVVLESAVPIDLRAEVRKVRDYEALIMSSWSTEDFERNRGMVVDNVFEMLHMAERQP